MSFELPPEIWPQILVNLPLRSLNEVSAVSRLFHALSTPLLFAKFQFHPGLYVEELTAGTLLNQEMERLAFWSSDNIAPLVQTCLIALYLGPITLDTDRPLVRTLFETVSRFKNLRILKCKLPWVLVDFPALRIEALAHLRRLHIFGARLVLPIEPTNVKITVPEFSYTDILIRPSGRLSGFPMLNPTVLRSLELGSAHDPGAHGFLDDQLAMAACKNLHTLRLSFVDTDFTRLHACVAPFTVLRALIVAVSGECRANGIPSTPLAPRLKFYRGPVALLPLVLTGAEPEGLDITHGSAGAVLDALRTAGCPEWITLLSIGVKLHTDVVSGAVLHPLLALCPRLAHLTLVISANEGVLVAVPAFHAALVEILALPRALETVAFRWRPDGVENEFVPDRAELETLLRATVPSLTHVFLNDRGHRGMAFGNFTTPV